MPEQLLYLAEVICFLKGHKPVLMVQYTDPDRSHQWKFPEVHSLIRRILAIKSLHPDAGIGYTINKYMDKYETLLLWHAGTKHLADGLMPQDTQAFHIVPFPDGVNNDSIYREQVKWSWRNGYLLGYPTRFIDTYTRDLTKLEPDVVDFEMREGYASVRDYLHSLGKADDVTIGARSVELASSNFLKFSKAVLGEHHVFLGSENKEYL